MCVFCGYCVEACPVDAIHMDANEVAISSYSRKDMIWDMPELLGDKPKLSSQAGLVLTFRSSFVGSRPSGPCATLGS